MTAFCAPTCWARYPARRLPKGADAEEGDGVVAHDAAALASGTSDLDDGVGAGGAHCIMPKPAKAMSDEREPEGVREAEEDERGSEERPRRCGACG